MSLQGTYQIIISALGISLQDDSSTPIQATQGIDPADVTVPAAKTVTDWVKTDANTAPQSEPSHVLRRPVAV